MIHQAIKGSLRELSATGIQAFMEHGGYVVIPARVRSVAGLYFKEGRVYDHDKDVGGYLLNHGNHNLILRHDRDDPRHVESVRWRLLERRVRRYDDLASAKARFRELEPDFGHISRTALNAYLRPDPGLHALEQLGTLPGSEEAEEAARAIIALYRDINAQQRRIVKINSFLDSLLYRAYAKHYGDDPRRPYARAWTSTVVIRVNGRDYSPEMGTWPVPGQEILDLG